MSNLQRVAFSLVMFALSAALLIFGPRLLGKSHLLTASVIVGFASAVAAMFPVEAEKAADDATTLLNKWRGK